MRTAMATCQRRNGAANPAPCPPPHRRRRTAADATTATIPLPTITTSSSTTTSIRRKAIPRLGLDVPKAQLSADRLNQLFDEWDPDKSGRLSLAELVKKLRRCAAASEREWSCRGPAPARQVGSVGPVRSARLTPRPAQW